MMCCIGMHRSSFASFVTHAGKSLLLHDFVSSILLIRCLISPRSTGCRGVSRKSIFTFLVSVKQSPPALRQYLLRFLQSSSPCIHFPSITMVALLRFVWFDVTAFTTWHHSLLFCFLISWQFRNFNLFERNMRWTWACTSLYSTLFFLCAVSRALITSRMAGVIHLGWSRLTLHVLYGQWASR